MGLPKLLRYYIGGVIEFFYNITWGGVSLGTPNLYYIIYGRPLSTIGPMWQYSLFCTSAACVVWNNFEALKLKTCIWSFVFDSSFDYKVSEGPLASLACLNVWTNHGRARFYGHPIIIRVRLKAKKEWTRAHSLKAKNEVSINCSNRGGICHCRHCRGQCRIFASSVNFSIFTHFLCFFPLTLLKLGEIDGVKFLTNSMSESL